jgi:hypothetical protein
MVVDRGLLPDEAQWEAFGQLPATAAALDAVPDRVSGLLVYRGRGGGAGARTLRRPRPTAGAGAIELPEPEDERIPDLTATAPSRPFRDLWCTM